MKKITMLSKIIETERILEETYEIENEADATSYAQGLIDYFNSTLRAGEKPRELVSVSEEQVDGEVHQWEKTNIFTLRRGGKSYDTYRCKRCGITDKRYGVSSEIVRDSKYKAKKYEKCQC